MTSRERVMKAVNYELPDRVPIDMGGSSSSSISAFAYTKLREYLGLPKRPSRVMDLMQIIAAPDEDVYERFHMDVVPLSLALHFNRWKDWKPRDGYDFLVYEGADLSPAADGEWRLKHKKPPGTYRMPAGGYFFDALEGGWYSYEYGLGRDEMLRKTEEAAKWLYENTPYAISGSAGAAFFSTAPDFLVRMITEPDKLYDQLAERCERAIKDIEAYLQAVGKYIFAIKVADDMGQQSGELANPEMMRETILPHYKRQIEWVHKHSDVKFYLHCCGSVYHLIEDFIACGVDILNPVQTSAANMEPEKLAEEFGGRIVFWGGGCDTQTVLPTAAPDEIREHVKERINIFAPTKGFTFAAVHNVMGDVPPENVTAMLEAAFDEGTRFCRERRDSAE